MEYRDIIDKLSEKTPMPHVELRDIDAKVWQRLKEVDTQSHDKYMNELEGLVYSIDKEEAEKIVQHMHPFGQVWSCQDIKNFLAEKGITENLTNWYLVMNMAKNDYINTARNYGLENDPNFFYLIARDFILDEDAKPYKVERYFK